MDPLLDSVPPHSIEAEQAVLGAMMLDPSQGGLAVERLMPDDFYRLEHRTIFVILREAVLAGQAIDLVTMSERLKEKGQLEGIGGQDYLVTLADSVPTVANSEYYAGIVLSRSRLRQIIQAGAEMIREASQVGSDPADVLDHCEQQVFAIAERGQIGGPVPIGVVLDQLAKQLRESGSLDRGIETGYASLDNGLRGFHKGDLIILASRTTIGKSALALNIAENVVVHQNKAVVLFSLEMNREELGFRLVASQSAISAWRLRHADLAPEKIDAVVEVAEKMKEAALFVDDTPGLHISELRGRVRRLVLRRGVELVIVDYLQLVRGVRRKGDSREQEVSSVSRGLKLLARECKVPVLALAQLKRGVAGVRRKPQISDLRESGAQEQDADVVLLLHKEAEFGPQANRAELTIAKARHGPKTRIALTWIPDRVRFESEAPEPPQAEPPKPTQENLPY